MNKEQLRSSREWIREELDRCVTFWLEHGMDPSIHIGGRLDAIGGDLAQAAYARARCQERYEAISDKVDQYV